MIGIWFNIFFPDFLSCVPTKYSNKYNLMSAAAVLVALPVVTLYIFFQRKFIQGVLTGALKG
jgi:raffinose/stachyose/melibiose transport system permease protein